MPDLSPKQLKNDARLALTTGTSNYKRIISIYAAIMLGISFFASLSYFVVDLLILNTAGGLAGLGATGTLKGITSFVDLIVSIATPFLTMSLMHCAIGFARQDHMEANSLKEGFYRWGVFLRLTLLQCVVYIGVIYLAAMLTSVIFMMLPLDTMATTNIDAAQLQAQLTDLPAETSATPAAIFGTIYVLWELFGSLIYYLLLILFMFLVLMLVLLVPLYYSYRMSFYRIMDNNHPGARQAIAQSRVMMKGRRFKLFRLDLSFWWYYLLQGLASAVVTTAGNFLYGLFPGVELLCSGVLCAAMFFIYRKYLAYVETTYAVFYDKVLQLYLPQQPMGEPVQYQPPIELIPQKEEPNTEE